MTYNIPFRWGPVETAPSIRWLIAITASISLLVSLIDPLLVRTAAYYEFDYRSLQEFLLLSWGGISQFFIWQPITYLFTQVSPEGMTLFYLVGLFFTLYLLWILGSGVQEVLGSTRALAVYFISGILSGIVAVLTMALTGQFELISGPMPALLGLFTVWTMLFPENDLMLFFLFPVKTKWLFAAVLAATSLISLAHFNLVDFVLYLSATFAAYAYGVMAVGLRAAFPFFHPLDDALLHVKSKFQRRGAGPKIFDFKSGQLLMNDDEFLDAMLTKIAKNGINSLSGSEQRRLNQISKGRKGR